MLNLNNITIYTFITLIKLKYDKKKVIKKQ